MGFLHDDVLDNGLVTLTNDADVLHVCDSQPASFAEVATKTLGNKAAPSVGSPGARTPNGRKVTGTDSATHWALVDTVGERLLAANTLGAGQMVTDGNTFNLASFDVGIPAPA